MTTAPHINSLAYWDNHFADDWARNGGPARSRFFAYLALENLPGWLVAQIRRQSLTVADWGCAQGDGTDVWASHIGADRITGIDFSAAAITQAATRYPAIRFVDQDWLETTDGEQFDIVFSSNTLQHFSDPRTALQRVARKARKAVALALPFREIDRVDEHFFTFLPENIPLVLDGPLHLIWSKVINCGLQPDSHTRSDQIILLYASADWVRELSTTLSDVCIEKIDTADSMQRLANAIAQRDRTIARLDQRLGQQQQKLAQHYDQSSRKEASLLEHDNLEQKLKQAVLANAALEEQVRQLRLLTHENELFIQEQGAKLIEISDWAANIDRRPFSHGTVQLLVRMYRAAYRNLPLSTERKLFLRATAIAIARKLRRRAAESRPVVAPAVAPEIPQAVGRIHRSEQRDVFVFSLIDWNFRTQRPQHLARSFAQSGRRVFFFSNHFVDSNTPGYHIERLDAALDLYQVKLHVPEAPAIYFAAATPMAQRALQASLASFMLDFGTISTISIVQHAYWYTLVRRVPNTLCIYDCMDHHEGFGNVAPQLVELEKAMLRQSDLVVVTSSWLETFAKDFTSRVAIVRNAGEYDCFANAPREVYSDRKRRKIIGYFGAIAEWFDVDLVREVALANPDCLVLLVGNDTVDAASRLAAISNIAFTGEVPYAQLPFYLHAFDVCLLPFKVIPLTLATNPVKVYEYLAAGKPVVCVDLPEIVQFENLVWRAGSRSEFVQHVAQALEPAANLPGLIDARKRFAAAQTWNHRIGELNEALDNLELPKISVVVLTYNNLDLTKACLRSVLEESEYPNLEIIIVDNASSDGTPAWLREFASEHTDVRVILNTENLGFAAGNNVGLAAATGDYLVILNNDTVVTCGWALTLMHHLRADPTIGLIGPLTNNIGNEARIEMRYENVANMPLEAFRLTLSNMGKLYPIKNVAFFCAMLTRKAYELCGPISEDYGRGFFEDDDYCRVLEQAGLRTACADDVFVHHHLSASFNKLPSQDRQDLFNRNRKIYEAKWGPWAPHSYRQ